MGNVSTLVFSVFSCVIAENDESLSERLKIICCIIHARANAIGHRKISHKISSHTGCIKKVDLSNSN